MPGTFHYEYPTDDLDPAKEARKRIPEVELEHIAIVLERIRLDNLTGLHPHGYDNYPDSRTGAVLPPSIKGYQSIDVPNPELTRGKTRILKNLDNGDLYYTNIHNRGFYPIKPTSP